MLPDVIRRLYEKLTGFFFISLLDVHISYLSATKSTTPSEGKGQLCIRASLYESGGNRAGPVSGTNFVVCSYGRFLPAYRANISARLLFIWEISNTEMNKT